MFVKGYSNIILKGRFEYISYIIVYILLFFFVDDSIRSVFGIYDFRMVGGDICINVCFYVYVGFLGICYGNIVCKC